MKQNQRIEQVLYYYNQGLNNREIAGEIGLKSVSSISYYLKVLNLKSNHKDNVSMEERLGNTEYNKLVIEIKKLLNKGETLSGIGKMFGIDRQTIRRICKKEKIIVASKFTDMAKKSALSLKEREKLFAENLKAKDCTKEYHHGFSSIDKKCYIKCLECGSIYQIHCQVVRYKANKIFCKKCSETNKEQRLITNKLLMEQRQKQKDRLTKIKNSLKYIQLEFNICRHCGNLFVGKGKYCNKRCSNRNHEAKATRLRINRAKRNGNIDNDITLDKLIQRDNNVCHICNKECDLNDYTYKNNSFVAGNNYPSIDHVIPLAKGGTHTWSNVKLAHRQCNSLKSDKLIEENEQIGSPVGIQVAP